MARHTSAHYLGVPTVNPARTDAMRAWCLVEMCEIVRARLTHGLIIIFISHGTLHLLNSDAGGWVAAQIHASADGVAASASLHFACPDPHVELRCVWPMMRALRLRLRLLLLA